MIRAPLLLVPLALLAACREQAPPASPENAASTVPPLAQAKPAETWVRDGQALRFAGPGPRIELRCAAGQLRVTLPDTPGTASEERLSFGGGGAVVALVANPVANPLTGEGPAPAELAAMLSAGPSASYGAASIGPLPPVEPAAAAAFAARCGRAPPPPPAPGGSACRIQDGKPIAGPALRAIGTEPFWGAAIDGRCVTYSTPEDQAGTRIWTRRSEAGGVTRFAGSLEGQLFELRLRAAPGCSDGMSDQRYPMAAELTVRGEQRTGCATMR